jgi:hypothetical protein
MTIEHYIQHNTVESPGQATPLNVLRRNYERVIGEAVNRSSFLIALARAGLTVVACPGDRAVVVNRALAPAAQPAGLAAQPEPVAA